MKGTYINKVKYNTSRFKKLLNREQNMSYNAYFCEYRQAFPKKKLKENKGAVLEMYEPSL